MTDFLTEVLTHAREHYTEEDRKKKERDTERLARWQRFKANYETFLLAVRQLDGIKTLEQRKTETKDKIQGVLRVASEYWQSADRGGDVETLPAEPPWDRHYVIRMVIEAPDRPAVGYAAWLLQWKHETQPETKYAMNDKCWFCFHRNEMGTIAELKSDVVKRLRARIDMSEYIGGPNDGRPGIDM